VVVLCRSFSSCDVGGCRSSADWTSRALRVVGSRGEASIEMRHVVHRSSAIIRDGCNNALSCLPHGYFRMMMTSLANQPRTSGTNTCANFLAARWAASRRCRATTGNVRPSRGLRRPPVFACDPDYLNLLFLLLLVALEHFV